MSEEYLTEYFQEKFTVDDCEKCGEPQSAAYYGMELQETWCPKCAPVQVPKELLEDGE